MSATYDVFISYARADGERARMIRQELEKHGLTCFFDMEGIDTGEEFPDVIDRAVKGAKCVLGLWSRAAFAGRWVRIESRIGLDQKKLVACMIDGTRPEDLPAEFYNVNVERLTDYRGQADHAGWARILRTIGKRVGRSDLAGAPAPASPAPAPATPATTQQINPLLMIGAVVVIGAGIFLFARGDDAPNAAASRFSENAVFAAGAPTVNLTGAWSGTFEEGGMQTPFTAQIEPGAMGAFTGRITEPSLTVILGVSAETLASINGTIDAEGIVRFTKTYEATGHSVSYEGRVQSDGSIAGMWNLNGRAGPFRMTRS